MYIVLKILLMNVVFRIAFHCIYRPLRILMKIFFTIM